MKVGADLADDLRRHGGRLIRSIIEDPQYLPDGHEPGPVRDTESTARVRGEERESGCGAHDWREPGVGCAA
jgi:hypothetical protein